MDSKNKMIMLRSLYFFWSCMYKGKGYKQELNAVVWIIVSLCTYTAEKLPKVRLYKHTAITAKKEKKSVSWQGVTF